MDVCGVWPNGAACGAPAVEVLVFLNPWMPVLPVCAEHLAEYVRDQYI